MGVEEAASFGFSKGRPCGADWGTGAATNWFPGSALNENP